MFRRSIHTAKDIDAKMHTTASCYAFAFDFCFFFFLRCIRLLHAIKRKKKLTLIVDTEVGATKTKRNKIDFSTDLFVLQKCIRLIAIAISCNQMIEKNNNNNLIMKTSNWQS